MSDVQTLPAGLSAEIERVSHLKRDAEEFAKKFPAFAAGTLPMRAMMAISLNAARQAMNSPDIEAMARAYHDLKGYTG